MFVNYQELLQKYLKGDCSEEEEAILFKWYNSFEGEADPLDSLTDAQAQEVKLRMLSRIRTNIQDSTDIQSGTIKKRGVRIKPLLYWLSGAAAIALIVFSISLLNKKDISSCNVQVTVNNLTESIHKVMLSDSSIVWLSPQSQLHYPKKFTGAFRTVSMEGEAFFEVSKDPKHPFVINSGEVITKVLGTSFRIQAFAGSESTEVSVVSGKVSISTPQRKDSEVLILPSQKVTYLKEKKLLKKNQEEKSSSIRIWEKTTMSFENTPVSEVMSQLNKRFDVQISSEDKDINGYVLNADFSDQSLPSILEMLEKSLNVTYIIRDKKISLNKKLNNQTN